MTRMSMIFFAFTLSFSAACGSASTAEGPSAQADTRIYECPMQCVKPGETLPYTHVGPADCPVCGMHLEPRPAQPSTAPAPH